MAGNGGDLVYLHVRLAEACAAQCVLERGRERGMV
jgi:hypothetical protein